MLIQMSSTPMSMYVYVAVPVNAGVEILIEIGAF
jgi:hypothetical protein